MTDGTDDTAKTVDTQVDKDATTAKAKTVTKPAPEVDDGDRVTHDQIGYHKRQLAKLTGEQTTSTDNAKLLANTASKSDVDDIRTELAQVKIERDIALAIGKYKLSDSDTVFLTGNDTDTIQKQAKALSERGKSTTTESDAMETDDVETDNKLESSDKQKPLPTRSKPLTKSDTVMAKAKRAKAFLRIDDD